MELGSLGSLLHLIQYYPVVKIQNPVRIRTVSTAAKPILQCIPLVYELSCTRFPSDGGSYSWSVRTGTLRIRTAITVFISQQHSVSSRIFLLSLFAEQRSRCSCSINYDCPCLGKGFSDAQTVTHLASY